VIFGGTVAPDDVAVLKQAGIAEVFGPGTPLRTIVEYISEAATESD
jgi:methylmalonyl-CoA mutase C-terminal domain/subunit